VAGPVALCCELSGGPSGNSVAEIGWCQHWAHCVADRSVAQSADVAYMLTMLLDDISLCRNPVKCRI
jgi:hypothetical protein